MFRILADSVDSFRPEVWIPLIVSVLSLFGIGTLASLFWKDRYEKKKEQRLQNSEATKRAAKEERIGEIQDVMQKYLDKIDKRLTRIEEEIAKTRSLCEDSTEAAIAGLRNDILNVYYQCAKKGFRSKNDSENFWDLYRPYHKLGGNSFIDSDVIKWFEELPSKEVYLKEQE